MTTHPEVPQATAREEAREQAIEVMAKALSPVGRLNNPDGEYRRQLARTALDALLAATQDEPCAPCEGTGKEPGYVAPLGHPDSARCVKCNGSGRVPGAPLVLLAPEQVGAWCPKGGGHAVLAPEYDEDSEAWWEGGELRDPCGSHSRGFPLFRAPFIEAQREEA